VKRYTCSLTNHHNDCSPNLPLVTVNGITRRISSHAFGGLTRNIRFTSDIDYQSLDFMNSARELIQETLDILKAERCHIKISSSLCITFEKIADEVQRDEAYFSVKAINLESYDLDFVIQTIEDKIQSYTQRGSNWKIVETNFFELNTINCKI